MPQYFLHIQLPHKLIEDLDGEMFDTLDDARQAAIQSAREIMSKQLLKGDLTEDSLFIIADADGHTVLSVPFKDAIHRR